MGMMQSAYIGWGISLVDSEYGEGQHESIVKDVYELADSDKYKDLLELVYGGHCDFSFPVIYLKRSYTGVDWGIEEVTSDVATAPLDEEREIFNRFLDEAGFTGDRTIKLLLVVAYG